MPKSWCKLETSLFSIHNRIFQNAKESNGDLPPPWNLETPETQRSHRPHRDYGCFRG
ncbi:unnamed protein product [Hymenolepis diminuta]|uniref:Uncharacterized protein n=1 Tax=Hymenolepis diminuta TaxID=6216 RepID=A0A0R3SN96_HYMDI|nr:unnamed protein product [Hymenolepis diminuta]